MNGARSRHPRSPWTPPAPLLAAALTATALATTLGAPAAAAAPAVTAVPGARVTTVTLLTGDRVTIASPAAGRSGLLVTPGPGRVGVPLHLTTSAGPAGTQDVSVLPADAAGLITTARLDPRLFDVTLLAREGYRSACAAAQAWSATAAGRTVAMPASWPGCPLPHGLPAVAPAAPPAGTKTYPVRVRVLNRAGQALPPASGQDKPPYSVLGTVLDTATGAAPSAIGYDKAAGAYTMRLPAGHWYLDGLVATAGYRAAMVKPDVTVHGATTITLAAAAAVPVTTLTGHAGAAALFRQAEIDQTVAGKPVSSAYGGFYSPDDIQPFYLTPTAAVTGRPFTYSLHTALSDRASFPEARHPKPASYEYQLAFVHQGSIPASLSYRVQPSQLATVQTTFHTQRATLPTADSAQLASLPTGPGNEFAASFDAPVVIAPAGHATIYYTAAPRMTWFRNYFLNDVADDPGDLSPLTSYTPGRSYHVSFDDAALSPAGLALRQGNTLAVVPAPFSPSEPGHTMPALSSLSMDGSSVTSTLSLHGKVIDRTTQAQGAAFSVPAARGRYTLTEVADRSAPSWTVLGSHSTATWSFYSRHVAGAVSALPLLTVQASGSFSITDSVPAGHTAPLTFGVQELPAGARVTSLTVDASVNDGKTWTPVSLHRSGGHWLGQVTGPAGAGFVSLRTRVADSAGDTATATTIRAYAVTAGAGERRYVTSR